MRGECGQRKEAVFVYLLVNSVFCTWLVIIYPAPRKLPGHTHISPKNPSVEQSVLNFRAHAWGTGLLDCSLGVGLG